jgi:glycosyltransferase involved in cell wall biosynthesis
MAAWGLGSHFRYAGAPDRAAKIALLQSFDVLSVPTVYHEPKGLFLLEAMANAIPVVQPRHGAFPEIIDRAGGGITVPSGDVDGLARALFDLLVDREKAGRLGQAGAEGVRRQYGSDQMVAAAERACQEMDGCGEPTFRSAWRLPNESSC